MTYEMLVGLTVTDDASYQRYRIGMTPLLHAIGGTQNPILAYGLITAALLCVSFYTSISGLVKAEMFPAEVRALGAETLAVVRDALETLPPAQQTVVRLRDLEGWTAAEVCNALDLTETNQRVLLHRGRARLRAALEEHFAEATTG